MALLDTIKRLIPGRRRREPVRDTVPFARLANLGQNPATSPRRVLYKPTPINLRYFSHTPVARRAINAVKAPIAMLDWEVAPAEGVAENSEIRRQIRVVTDCLNSPNADDSFRTLTEQVIEDVLCGAGAIEVGIGGDPARPLWLWPADGLSIQIFPGWSGGEAEARYLQSVGYATGDNGVLLRNGELIYIRPNPSTATPFGFGPLEIAFADIARQLGVAEFAGKLASNARPSVGLDLGEGVGEDAISQFRAYWRNEVESQGEMPIWGMGQDQSSTGKARGPAVMRFYPEGDAGMFLKYQEFQRSVIACAFDISAQNLNVERDVNRSTSEVAEDRDWNHAIKPMAMLYAAHINRDAIQGRLGFSQVRFRYTGLERADEQAAIAIEKTLYEVNGTTPNEIRDRRGLPPSLSQWGDMTAADVEIAKNAARSAGLIEDRSLPVQGGAPAGRK